MSVSTYRVWIMALCAVVISLAAIAVGTYSMITAVSNYSMIEDLQAAPSTNATQRSIGENFNWIQGEVVNVQGHLYSYVGYEYAPSSTYLINLLIAKWEKGWITITYPILSLQVTTTVILSPFKLVIGPISADSCNATFINA